MRLHFGFGVGFFFLVVSPLFGNHLRRGRDAGRAPEAPLSLAAFPEQRGTRNGERLRSRPPCVGAGIPGQSWS